MDLTIDLTAKSILKLNIFLTVMFNNNKTNNDNLF